MGTLPERQLPPRKVALVASAGGHLSQLLKIVHACAWTDCRLFVVTTSDVVRNTLHGFDDIYVVGECNREHLFRVLGVLWRCARIVRRERPDVVVSTGAAPGCLICFLAKLRGAKVVWIDSITNVEHVSLSGRMVRHIADLFLVQWPELAHKYRGAQYVGAVI